MLSIQTFKARPHLSVTLRSKASV